MVSTNKDALPTDSLMIDGVPYILEAVDVVDSRGISIDAEIADDSFLADPWDLARQFINLLNLTKDQSAKVLEIADEVSSTRWQLLTAKAVRRWVVNAENLTSLLNRHLEPTEGRPFLTWAEMEAYAESLTKRERLGVAKQMARLYETDADDVWARVLLGQRPQTQSEV